MISKEAIAKESIAQQAKQRGEGERERICSISAQQHEPATDFFIATVWLIRFAKSHARMEKNRDRPRSGGHRGRDGTETGAQSAETFFRDSSAAVILQVVAVAKPMVMFQDIPRPLEPHLGLLQCETA